MTHRILLREVVIDVPTRDLEAATTFWAAALATQARPLKDYSEFIALQNPASRCVVGLQDVGDAPARFHIDIESDDVEAEVARLVSLGATELERHHTWVVMRDPAGTVFCVVRVQLPEAFDAHATTWD